MIRMMLNDQYDKMPWDMIDAVVFDVGNVLLDYSPDKILQERLPERTDLHERLKQKMMKSPYWIMLDHGALTLEEAIEVMTGRDKELEPFIRQVLEKSIELHDALPEGVETLRRCKAHGKKTYVLSNFHEGAFQVAVREHAFFSLFDDVVVSAKEHLVKPDPAVFKLLTERFHLDPARTLFIDDSPANIEMALMMDWQGVCYSENGQLTKFFSE